MPEECEFCNLIIGQAITLDFVPAYTAPCDDCGNITLRGPCRMTGIYQGVISTGGIVKHKIELDSPIMCPGCGLVGTHFYPICRSGAMQLFGGAVKTVAAERFTENES